MEFNGPSSDFSGLRQAAQYGPESGFPYGHGIAIDQHCIDAADLPGKAGLAQSLLLYVKWSPSVIFIVI